MKKKLTQKELQNLFCDSVTKKNIDQSLADVIIASGDLSPQDGLEIYSDSFFANLDESLSDSFETTKILLGEDFFTKIVKSFIQNYPPSSYDLGHFGIGFSQYLYWCLPEEQKFISAVAEIEFTQSEVFLMPDGKNLSPKELEKLSLSHDYYFELNKNFKILELKYPVLELWEKNKKIEDVDKYKKEKKQYICFYRNNEDIFYFELTAIEKEILTKLGEEISLANVLDHLECDSEYLSEGIITNLFEQILKARLISKVHIVN